MLMPHAEPFRELVGGSDAVIGALHGSGRFFPHSRPVFRCRKMLTYGSSAHFWNMIATFLCWS
jgi:hypothetical protein